MIAIARNPTSTAGGYERNLGLYKAATRDEIRGPDRVLWPRRSVGAAAAEEDDVPFVERFAALKEKLDEQLAQGEELGALIQGKLEGVVVDG